MKKFVCPVCGYVHEGESAPEKCPQCGVPGSKFTVMEEESLNFVCEHVIGVGAERIDPPRRIRRIRVGPAATPEPRQRKVAETGAGQRAGHGVARKLRVAP